MKIPCFGGWPAQPLWRKKQLPQLPTPPDEKFQWNLQKQVCETNRYHVIESHTSLCHPTFINFCQQKPQIFHRPPSTAPAFLSCPGGILHNSCPRYGHTAYRFPWSRYPLLPSPGSVGSRPTDPNQEQTCKGPCLETSKSYCKLCKL